jgi:hypothetical protein
VPSSGRCPTPDRRIDLLTTNLVVRSSNLFGRANHSKNFPFLT